MRNLSRTPRRAKSALFEACEKRQHMAADLVVSSISTSDPLMPIMYHPQNYTVQIANVGTSSVSPNTGIVVTLYSVDHVGDTSPEYLDSTTVWGFDRFTTKTLSFRTTAYYRSDNEGYVIAEIDSQNAVQELNEANNKYRGIDIDMLQYCMEADVSSPSGSVNARPLALDGRFIDGYLGDESMAGRDIDTYKVSLTGGKTYWFEMYEVDNRFNGAMRLFNANLEQVAISLSDPIVHGDRGAYIEFVAPATGDYYLALSTEVNKAGSITNIVDRFAYLEHGPYKLAAAEKDWSDIQVTSLDPYAVEGAPNDQSSGLEFVVRREWGNQWWRPLTVNLEVTGQFNNDLVETIPTTVTFAPNQGTYTFRSMPVQDSINEMTETHWISAKPSPDYRLGSHPTQTIQVFDNPVTHRPFALTSSYIWSDRAGPRTAITFSEDVGYSISRDDYILTNRDTGAMIPSSKYQVLWSPTINGSIVYFNGFENGQLPDGNYRMTLRKNSVYTWPDGKQLENDVSIDFFSLRGDTNGDRAVDFNDLLTVAQNYGMNSDTDGGAYKGDFDRNGKVDFNDLLVLAQSYGHRVAAPTAGLRSGNVCEGIFGREVAIV